MERTTLRTSVCAIHHVHAAVLRWLHLSARPVAQDAPKAERVIIHTVHCAHGAFFLSLLHENFIQGHLTICGGCEIFAIGAVLVSMFFNIEA